MKNNPLSPMVPKGQYGCYTLHPRCGLSGVILVPSGSVAEVAAEAVSTHAGQISVVMVIGEEFVTPAAAIDCSTAQLVVLVVMGDD
jgi:hypothetical protein